ncbi:MAG: hypothetical protein RL326_487 [Pseudomonadota bacterium]
MTEGLPSPNDREISALLRTSKRRKVLRVMVQLAWGLVFSLFAALLISHLNNSETSSPERDRARLEQDLISIQQPWADALAVQWDSYREWLSRHAIRQEAELFDSLSTIVVHSAINSNAASIPVDELGLLGKAYLAFHTGGVRVLFFVFASARLCFVVGVVAFFFGITGVSAYTKEDALGQMGNGRVFYSGARAGLEKLAANGAPDVQIRGFACPQFSTVAEAQASPIWRVIKKYGAANATNEFLTRILVKNGSTAPYVAFPEEEELLKRSFSGDAVALNTAHLLDVTLQLHALYRAGEAPEGTPASASRSDGEGALSSSQFAQRVAEALHQVLSPTMRVEIASISPHEIATALLALESGKILAHSFEGGRWVRRSNFPHLSARAVLHSVVEYPKDYSFEQRARIRRALIYAARKSAFAPVRMPIDMTDDCWVLRQWMEVFLACPHELTAVTDEVELVGIVRESHQSWCGEFFESGTVITPEISAHSYSTPTELLFLPVVTVVNLLRKVVPSPRISRMHYLLERVRTKQQLQRLHTPDGDSGPIEQLSFDRVVTPPSEEDLLEIARLHGMRKEDLSDWLALKVILSSYGWLASRVGDYSVPETSTIFAVFKPDSQLEGVNSLGLLGKSGMVPVRGSKLEPRWGRQWANRFVYVRKVTMAETMEDYEKLLQGIEDIDDPIDDSAARQSTVVS